MSKEYKKTKPNFSILFIWFNITNSLRRKKKKLYQN